MSRPTEQPAAPSSPAVTNPAAANPEEAAEGTQLQFQVVLYPEPVLRQPAEDVAIDEDLKRLVAAMYRCMHASNGVGLAAPQVGLKKRVLVLNPLGKEGGPEDDLTLVNPRIVGFAGARSTYEEGCLSFPGIYAEVLRPERCTVEALDVDGKPIRAEYDGFVSRIIQHEYDHLEGVLLVDRMSPADRQRHKAALEDLKHGYREAKEKRKRAAELA